MSLTLSNKWHQILLLQYKSSGSQEEELFANLTPREDFKGDLVDEYLLKISKKMMKYRLNVFLL